MTVRSAPSAGGTHIVMALHARLEVVSPQFSSVVGTRQRSSDVSSGAPSPSAVWVLVGLGEPMPMATMPSIAAAAESAGIPPVVHAKTVSTSVN